MPWEECSVMEERLRFVARLLDGEGMSAVCREFGISRKTGYKISTATRITGSMPSPTARAGRCAMPTSCPSRWSG
jgi:transposase